MNSKTIIGVKKENKNLEHQQPSKGFIDHSKKNKKVKSFMEYIYDPF